MPESKLPPAPWRVLGVDYSPTTSQDFFEVHRIIDAAGADVIAAEFHGECDGYISLDASPEVLRAVLKIPELLALAEAARGVRASLDRGELIVAITTTYEEDIEIMRRVSALRAALALVDGEGRADGTPAQT